jgi:hypothetical protein
MPEPGFKKCPPTPHKKIMVGWDGWLGFCRHPSSKFLPHCFNSCGTVSDMNYSDFDLDFADGRVGEELVDKLLTGGLTVEVKTDRKWADTGNLYVETSCYRTSTQQWHKSGLDVSIAAYWAFVLNGGTLLVPTNIVRRAIAMYGRYITCDIEPNPTKGWLLRVDDLLNCLRDSE